MRIARGRVYHLHLCNHVVGQDFTPRVSTSVPFIILVHVYIYIKHDKANSSHNTSIKPRKKAEHDSYPAYQAGAPPTNTFSVHRKMVSSSSASTL